MAEGIVPYTYTHTRSVCSPNVKEADELHFLLISLFIVVQLHDTHILRYWIILRCVGGRSLFFSIGSDGTRHLNCFFYYCEIGGGGEGFVSDTT